MYNDTYYIPNDKIRLIEVPMNSSLYFQMLLFYHKYFDYLYGLLLIPSGVYKMYIGDLKDTMIIVGLALTIVYCITEYFRLNFGNEGNLRESFPEMTAFLI